MQAGLPLDVPDSMRDPLLALDIGVNDPVNTRFPRRCKEN